MWCAAYHFAHLNLIHFSGTSGRWHPEILPWGGIGNWLIFFTKTFFKKANMNKAFLVQLMINNWHLFSILWLTKCFYIFASILSQTLSTYWESSLMYIRFLLTCHLVTVAG